MIHNQANNLLRLTLAGATLLCLVLECQAGEVHDEDIERAKKEWLSNWDERLGEHMMGKVTPEMTAEMLKQLHAAMPEDDSSEEWQKKRTELDTLIDMANVDEKCLARDVLERFNKKYDLSGYILPVLALVQNYAKYFQNKQLEICVAKISEQVEVAVASLSEDDKQDMETLMSYSPKLKASDNLEWDDLFVGAMKEGEEEERFYRDIYRFLKSKNSSPFEKTLPKLKFCYLYNNGMEFCKRVSSAMSIPADNYFNIRHFAELNEWTSRFSPETLKWIKAEKLCWQIKFNDDKARKAAYDEYIRLHKSIASKILDCVRPKRASD